MEFATQEDMDRNARIWLVILVAVILGGSTVMMAAFYSYQFVQHWFGR